jgi:hypothetical protein
LQPSVRSGQCRDYGAFALDRGYLDVSYADLAELADALGRDVARMLEH